MSAGFVLALDQGTTSSRAIVFDPDGRVRGSGQVELKQHFPQPGWVEHDPLDIWRDQMEAAERALKAAGVSAHELAAVGMTNQRETTVLWDKRTLDPLANAIVWQDRRTAPELQRMRQTGLADEVRELTGLELDPYFSASKLTWLLDNVPGARRRAEAGELAFGTIDTWLAAKLTGEHVTDVSNASRTLLFDISKLQWSERLLEIFNVPAGLLPRVVPTSAPVAEIASGPLTGAVLASLVGDQQAATFGQACLTPGQAKNTYGTGCFIMLNTGSGPRPSKHRLLTTVGWELPSSGVTYVLEGSVFMAGAVVQWLRDGLGVIQRAEDVEALARSVPDSGGVTFVPALTGLGAPHWDAYARGAALGLTRGTTAGHLARAALEGIALQVTDVVEVLEADSGIRLTELRVDGGASRNDLLMQLQADLLDLPVVRPEVTETTALGAAYLAGLAVGTWPSAGSVAQNWREERRFEPRMGSEERAAMRERWQRAVERAKGWEQP